MTVYLRDIDGSGSLHVCRKGDTGAIEFTPTPPTPADPVREAAKVLLPWLDAGNWQVTEGPYSHKNNMCRHERYGYEGCETCLEDAIRALSGDADEGACDGGN